MTFIIIGFLRLYQKTFSPDHGIFFGGFQRCRFYPSCSRYAEAAFRQYGLRRGFVFSLCRVLRCNPWTRGGYDPI